MTDIDKSSDLPDADLTGCVLTIGNFDGVHLGHQRILRTVRSEADARGAVAVAVTFDPPPDRVLRRADVPQRITPPQVKRHLLREAGAHRVVTLHTDKALLEMPPAEFIERIMLRRFAPAHVVEGHNFFFGCNRGGDVALLGEIGERLGFGVTVVDPVSIDIGGRSRRVSSSLVRRLLTDGKIDQANRCLGHQFSLHGRVVGGQGRGRMMQYPTANLAVIDQITPADGVYAARGSIGGREYPAAVSIGTKATFGESGRTIEAFLLNAEGNFYDESMVLYFVGRIRDQRRFADSHELRAQIAKDVKRVREMCK